jgi:drug/metabolite transporter (DMT)-like permease
MQTARQHALGIILVLAAALLWSFSGVAVKNLPNLDSMVITGYRSLFTIGVYVVAILVLAGPRRSPLILREALSRKAVLTSAAFYSLMLILFISATKLTTAANAIFLQYTAPVYVALLSRPLLGEPVGRLEWVTFFFCFLGMGCFFGDQLSTGGMIGNIAAILSGIACGLNMLSLKFLSLETQTGEGAMGNRSRLLRALPASLLGNLITVVICIPWMHATVPQTSQEWTILALMGVFQLGVPYLLFNIGILWISAIEGVLFAMLEAILNPIWTAWGAGEYPGPWAIVGGLLILGSISVFGLLKNRQIGTAPTS